MSNGHSENLDKVVDFAGRHGKKELRILLSFKSIKNHLEKEMENKHPGGEIDDSELNEVCLNMARYLVSQERDEPTEKEVEDAVKNFISHNKSERKIREYFSTKGFSVQDNPDVQTPSGKKQLDFKVYIDGWVLVEVTNPELSDRGKLAERTGVATCDNIHRFQSKVNNEYDHLRGADIDCPAVIIIDTEGSELGATPFLSDLKLDKMPEVSAVVNYNLVHAAYTRGARLGLVKLNESAGHRLSDRQVRALNFELPSTR